MTKIKATYHSGRTTRAGKVFNANHNTNKKTRDGQNHINHERTEHNLLYRVENNRLIPCKSYDCIVTMHVDSNGKPQFGMEFERGKPQRTKGER